VAIHTIQANIFADFGSRYTWWSDSLFHILKLTWRHSLYWLLSWEKIGFLNSYLENSENVCLHGLSEITTFSILQVFEL